MHCFKNIFQNFKKSEKVIGVHILDIHTNFREKVTSIPCATDEMERELLVIITPSIAMNKMCMFF
jgi:hypothetical protein